MLDSRKKGKRNIAIAGTRRVENLIDENIWTANPGDRIAKQPQTIEEKSQQLAVDAPDITGDWITVPTYFVVDYPNGERKALHHVRDAKAISDVIRLARFEQEEGDRELESRSHNFNVLPLILVFALFLLSFPILVGVF